MDWAKEDAPPPDPSPSAETNSRRTGPVKLRRRKNKATFVEGERARFLCGDVPALVLAIAADAAVLPPVNVKEAWPPAPLVGWGLFPRLTLTVVDGVDAGFLVQGARTKEEAEQLFGWLEDVEAARGAMVLADPAERQPADYPLDARTLYGQAGMHGGFVASLEVG